MQTSSDIKGFQNQPDRQQQTKTTNCCHSENSDTSKLLTVLLKDTIDD